MNGFKDHVESNISQWKEFYDLAAPHEAHFPHPYEDIQGLAKLIMLRQVVTLLLQHRFYLVIRSALYYLLLFSKVYF